LEVNSILLFRKLGNGAQTFLVAVECSAVAWIQYAKLGAMCIYFRILYEKYDRND
jgi:hypothetical protein